MRSEQILGNPKEKIFGVEILTAKEKPLKKNIFPKKNLQQGNGRETIFEISNESENKDHGSVKKENQWKSLKVEKKLNMENKEKAVAVSGKNDWYGDRFLCCVIRPPGMFFLTDAAKMVHTS